MQNYQKALFRYIGYIVLRGLQCVIRLGPSRITSTLGRRVGGLMYHIGRRRRGIALRNLALANPDLSDTERDQLCRRMFEHYGKFMMEFMRLPIMSRAEIDRRVRMHNLNYLDDALAAGKGVLVVSAHLGNWELLSAKLSHDGYKIGAIAKATRLGPSLQWMTAIRQSSGMRVFDRDDLFGVVRALRNNMALGILPDQHESDGVPVDFFGIPSRAPSGPAALARMTGATIVPAFAIRQSDDTINVTFHPPVTVTAGENKAEEIGAATQRIITTIEQAIRQAPEQWLWLHDRWKSLPATRAQQSAEPAGEDESKDSDQIATVSNVADRPGRVRQHTL